MTGLAGERIREIQERYDPRMAAELPPHLTLVGSSGLGPIAVTTAPEALRRALAPAAAATPPLVLRPQPPMHFMQSNVVVLPLDPNGLIRELHERMVGAIRAARIVAERARFTFTPHVTLNLYRELPRAELRALLAARITEEIAVDAVQVYRATTPTRTEQLFELRLGE